MNDRKASETTYWYKRGLNDSRLERGPLFQVHCERVHPVGEVDYWTEDEVLIYGSAYLAGYNVDAN